MGTHSMPQTVMPSDIELVEEDNAPAPGTSWCRSQYMQEHQKATPSQNFQQYIGIHLGKDNHPDVMQTLFTIDGQHLMTSQWRGVM